MYRFLAFCCCCLTDCPYSSIISGSIPGFLGVEKAGVEAVETVLAN